MWRKVENRTGCRLARQFLRVCISLQHAPYIGKYGERADKARLQEECSEDKHGLWKITRV
jgi:hypothetical protein